MSSRLPVTVITACFNSEKTVRQTVASVTDQEFSPERYLLMNDASTDGTLAILRELECEYDYIEVIDFGSNHGYTALLNHALSLVETEYVAVLDSDDIALNGWLSKTTRFLDENPGYGVVGGGGIIMTVDGQVTGHRRFCGSSRDVTEGLLSGGYFILHPGSVYRRSVAKQAGFYNYRLRSAEDHDFFMSIASFSRVYNLGVPLVLYRRSPASESRKSEMYQRKLIEFLSKKSALLKSGATVASANHELEGVIHELSCIPRLQPVKSGAYETEMASAFLKGGRYFLALKFYLKAAVANMRAYFWRIHVYR